MTADTPYNESSLRQLFREDPERALDILFREYYADVCRAVIRIIPRPEIAEDIAQDVFFELWRKRNSLEVNISFGAYLRRAARNKSLNYLRDHKIAPEGEEWLPELQERQSDAEKELELQDLQTHIDRAIDQLPERCRLIFNLSRFGEMSYQEIADQLGVSIKTVENQITKALRLLRESLGPHLSCFVGFITFILS